MPATAKDIQPTEIHQGPGDLWVIGAAPVDATPRLTLATDGTPDAVAHPGSIHLGAINALTTIIKPTMAPIQLDQYDAPFDSYLTAMEMKISADMAQYEMQKLQRSLGVGTYSTGAGFKQVVFGGNLVVPSACIAAISPKRTDSTKHWVSLLFKAVATGGFAWTIGRAQQSTYKSEFMGLSDPARSAGKRIGNIYETLVAAAGINPTAKGIVLGELFQGPVDLWILGSAPADGTQRVTLDAATLTPDSAVHGASLHLGGTEGAATFTVSTKLEPIGIDQEDGPLDMFVAAIEAKLEAELSQTAAKKLADALGVGVFTDGSPNFKQVTVGGINQPPVLSVAAIAPKRLDSTKAIVACLYRVNATEGVEISMSRNKKSTYKVTFTGLLDPARTAGRQIGIVHEMI